MWPIDAFCDLRSGPVTEVMPQRCPKFDRRRLNITVLSYLDHIDFGFVVCPEIVAEPWQLADATSAEYAELEQAATRTASPPKRASKTTAREPTDDAGS